MQQKKLENLSKVLEFLLKLVFIFFYPHICLIICLSTHSSSNHPSTSRAIQVACHSPNTTHIHCPSTPPFLHSICAHPACHPSAVVTHIHPSTVFFHFCLFCVSGPVPPIPPHTDASSQMFSPLSPCQYILPAFLKTL